jgi:molybdate transport system substrate-binding protein
MRRLLQLRASCIAVALASLLGLAARSHAEEVLLFAAASLTDAMKELGAAFEKRTGDHVAMGFGASSDLARQIEAGAPADVFFSADAAKVEQLEKAGLVDPAERREVLSNVLVVVVPADAKTTIGEPRDLTKLGRVALGNPDSVPVGIYAKKWLESVGIWQELSSKIVPTVDVRASLAAAESGHVEAAIVYATDAAISKRVRVAYRVPRDQGPPIAYVLAPIKTSKKPAARELTRFLGSREAAPTYERLGFIVRPPS